jgi:hypothetical protein
MTTIFALKGLLKAASEDLNMAQSLMLDKDCQEIFNIIDSINKLAEQSDKDSVSAVPVGLYAVGYYLAGIIINISTATVPVTAYIEQKPKRASKKTGFAKAHKPILRKLLECQELMVCFADAVHKSCCDPLEHVSSQIMVLLEHPLVRQDDQMQKQLADLLELIEGLLDRMFTIYQRLENHPILKIDASLVPDSLVY